METKNFVTELSELTTSNSFDQIVEFEKRYLNTFLLLEFPNRKKEFFFLFKIDKSDDRYIKKDKLYFSNQEIGEVVVIPESNVKIFTFFPKVGLYTYKNNLIYFGRFPERQWKRGICNQNIWIFNICASFLGKLNKIDPNTEMLQEFLEVEYPQTLSNACQIALDNPEINGLAISPLFGIVLPPICTEADFILLYRRTPVAFVYTKSRKIEIMYDPLEQEVIDLLNKTGDRQNWKIS